MKDIVKIQVSILTSEECQQTLVYNKDMSVYYQEPTSPEVLELMQGEYKKYFEYEFEYEDESKEKAKINILGEVEEQDF